MAWVSVPCLSVGPSRQRYTTVQRPASSQDAAGLSVIRYQSGDFSADVAFDAEGFVVDYPGLGRTG